MNWMLKYLSTRCATHKEQAMVFELIDLSRKRLFENRSNYKAVEIGAIKFLLRFTCFHCPSHSIQFDEEHNWVP